MALYNATDNVFYKCLFTIYFARDYKHIWVDNKDIRDVFSIFKPISLQQETRLKLMYLFKESS